MKRSKDFITPSEALRRVFLPSLNDISRHYSTRPFLRRSITRPQCLLSCLRPPPLRPHHPRHASTGDSVISWRPLAKTVPIARRFGPKDAPASQPRDEEINSAKIFLVRPEDNRLSEPRLLSEVLEMLERDDKGHPTQFVQEVSPPTEEIAYPVCKIYDKKGAREAEEAKRKASQAMKTKRQTKQLELRWSVTDYDLGYRMARLKEYLQKGWKVTLVFGSKRKSGWNQKREASPEEANLVLEKIRKTVGEVEGTHERRMEGEVGKEAILTFEVKAKK